MEFRADSTKDKMRLDNALLEFLPDFTRSKIQKMIEEGSVVVNSELSKPSYKIKSGDIIKIIKEEPAAPVIKPQDIPLDIVYEDNYLLVLNKQKGILTHPTPLNKENSLVNALLHYGCKLSDIQGEERRGIVHRLDKNTSGLIMIAKTNEAHLNLQKQIREKSAKRKYLAVVYGIIEQDEGIINKPLIHHLNKTVKMAVSKDNNGLEAITHFKVLKRFDDLTLLELELKTGRTHQIRCHMASINHPVYNDTLYGSKGFKSKIKFKTKEQLLMSYYLSFAHPITGKVMEFQLNKTQYDDDFKKFFNIMEEK